MKKIRFLSLLMTLILLFCSMFVFSVSADDKSVAQIIKSDGTVLGNYGSLAAAHSAAAKAKLNHYTMRLLKDVELTSVVKLNNSLAYEWTLDGNGHTVTQTNTDDDALHFFGNPEATVIIKRLNVYSNANSVYCESGNFIFLSGTYVSTDPHTWTDAAVSNNPKNENVSNVTIVGGTYISEMIEGNSEGKTQAAVRNSYDSVRGKAILTIYGGYFLSKSASTEKANDCVIYSGSYATKKGAVLTIYGGTFEAQNAKFVVTADYKSEMYIYGGDFIGDVYKFDGSVNEHAILNATADDTYAIINHCNLVGGGCMFRIISTKMTGENQGTFAPNTFYYYSYGKKTAPEASRQTFDAEDEFGFSTELNPVMTTGAALLLDGNTAGIRWKTKVPFESIEKLNALADEETELAFGTVITADEDVTYLTTDWLKGNNKAYIDVKGIATEIGDETVFTGSIVNIKEEYYGTNFRALSYIEVTIDGQQVRFYGLDEISDVTRSVKSLAQSALNDIKSVSDIEYQYSIDDGNFSCYTETERNGLQSFLTK